MDSFYGGKQGTSVVIKQRFEYITDAKNDNGIYLDKWYGQAIAAAGTNTSKIAEINNKTMTIKLSDENYKDVWYGEYCIIDTKNKNNPHNGKLYRRTLKKAATEDKYSKLEDAAGNVTEYIGQIVGPAGPPLFIEELNGTTNTESKFDSLGPTISDIDYLYFKDKNGNYKYIYETNDDLYIQTFNTQVDNSNQPAGGIKLIPGNTPSGTANIETKYFKNTTTDTIQRYIQTGGYNWFNYHIQDPETEEQKPAKFNLGIDLPYYVADFVKGNVLSEESPIQITKKVEGPFFNQYTISIPRGLRGAWFDNIRLYKIKDVDLGEKAPYLKAITYHAAANGNNDYWDLDITTSENYLTIPNDKKDAEYWAIDFNFRKVSNNNTITTEKLSSDLPLFIGWRKEIKNIEFDNENTGNFKITLTDNTVAIDKYLHIPLSIEMIAEPKADSGKIKYRHTTPSGSTATTLGQLNWINNATVSNNGYLNIYFNNNNITDISTDLRILNSIDMTTTGHITYNIKSNTNTKYDIGTLNWVTAIDKDNNNHVWIQFNNGSLINGGTSHNGTDYWIDLGNISIIKEGLYLSSNSDIFTYNNIANTVTGKNKTRTNVTNAFDSIGSILDEIYTSADDKNRARVVTLATTNGTQTLANDHPVYYYDFGDNHWKMLGILSSESVAAIIDAKIDSISTTSSLSAEGVTFITQDLPNRTDTLYWDNAHSNWRG